MRTDQALSSLARGVVWMSLASMGARAVTLLSSIILARLLLPEHFGLFNAAMIVINAVQLLPDLGLGQAIIALSAGNKRAASTSFYAILLTSGALALGVFCGANSLAALARQPELAPVLRVLALNIVVLALASVPIALMQQAQRWRAQAMIEFASPVASAVVMVLMAYWGYGIWSIVGGYMTRSAMLAFSVWVLSRWRPSGGFDWATLVSMFRFSRWIMMERFSAFLMFNVDNAYLARWQGAKMLGFYALPYNWISVPVQYFAAQSIRVLFPVLSAVESDEGRKSVLLRTLSMLSFLLSPIYFFWIFNAEVFVVALFGKKWLPSVPVLQWLAIYALSYSLAGGALTSYYWAVRRPQLVVYPTWIALLVAVGGLIWGRGSWDALAVAKWFTVAIYVRAFIALWSLRLCGDFSVKEIFGTVCSAFVPAALAASFTAGMLHFLTLPALAELLIGMAFHANLYLISYGLYMERRPFAYYQLTRWKGLLGTRTPLSADNE